MYNPRAKIKSICLAGVLLGLAAPLPGVAHAGGFGKTVYIPVQPTNQVAAAPVYQVAAAPSHRLLGSHRFAAAPLYQISAAPAYSYAAAAPVSPYAAAPAYSYAAAPVSPYAAAPAYPYAGAPAYPYAGAPAYPYAGAPAYPYAAAPAYPYAGAPAYPYAAAPAYPYAGAPPTPKTQTAPAPKGKGAGQLYYYPGYGYGYGTAAAPPGVAAAPGDAEQGQLSDSQFNKIVQKLKQLADSLNAAKLGDSDLRDSLNASAQDLYSESASTSYTDFSSTDKDAVKALVAAALGDDTPATPDKPKVPQATTPYAYTPAAAPVQLFLPVQVKHPLLHPYR